MHCLNCNTETQRESLEPGLAAEQCPTCQGTWLGLDDYRHWLDQAPPLPAEAVTEAAELVEETSPRALRCPDCAQLLQKYRVAGHLKFRLDRCGACRKVWLDGEEWPALHAQGLTHSLLHILSDRGQREVRESESRERRDATWRARLGDADYAEAQRVRAWLAGHPERAALLAFLQAADSSRG
ncbi:MAG TPA: zf-TFIIB domain-containing protein [Chitinolyticbacter sp.]|nr:zf-TFIIB domain-containing protein [Chitinolyticbacter sp.]